MVSPASFWEIAIKVSLGKYALNEPYDDFIQHAIFDNGFDILPIGVEARGGSRELATSPQRTPSIDCGSARRWLRGIPIVGVDTKFDPYPITRIW